MRVGAARYAIGSLSVDCENQGEHYATQAVVLVREHLAPDVERETLVHETLHAVVNQTNLRSGEMPKDEESLVSALSPLVTAWIRDNPRLMAWLQER